MPDGGISPCADDPLVEQLAGILCPMVKAGELKHLDSCRPKLSIQVCGVSRDTVRVNTALLTDEGVVITVFCGKCASTLCLEEQERHRRLEPGVSTRESLVNRTGGDHGPVRKSMAKNRADSMPAITEPPRPRFVKAACPQLAAQGSGRVASEAIDELHAAVGTALRPYADSTGRTDLRAPSWAFIGCQQIASDVLPPTACGVLGRSQRPGVGLGGGGRLGSDSGDQGAGSVAPDPQLTAEGVTRDGLTGPRAVRGVEVSRPGEQGARKHRGVNNWGLGLRLFGHG